MGMEMMDKAKLQEPDVLQYTNFRVYLRDYYEFKSGPRLLLVCVILPKSPVFPAMLT